MSAHSHEVLVECFGADNAAPNVVHPPERRQRGRSVVHWPVLLFQNGATEIIETTTQNLSCSGFYCLSRIPLTPGELLFCTVRIPSHEATSEKTIRVLECRIRVTRAEAAHSEGFFGIACRIEDYRFVTSHAAHHS